MKLYELTVHEIVDKLKTGEITSEELVKSYFERIKEKIKKITIALDKVTKISYNKGTKKGKNKL